MLKNKLVILTSLMVVTALSACGGKAQESVFSSSMRPTRPDTDMVIPQKDNEEIIKDENVVAPKELMLNHKVVGLYVGEKFQLSGLEQAYHTGDNLSFVSQDETIATVSENGEITGVKAGETSVEVADKNNPDLKVEVPIYVHAEVTSTRPRNRLVTALEEIDDSGLRSIVDHELYEKRLYKNGVLQTYDRYDQHLIASYPDAYFRIAETDAEVRTEGGAVTFTEYEWVFNTNKYYDTYVYHQVGDIKTFFPVSTVSYMDKERYVPMFEILDNLFTSGSSIFSNLFSNAKVSGFLEYVTNNYSNVQKNKYGSMGDNTNFANGEGSFLFDCKVTYADDTASQDDESRYGIPYGTPCPTVYNLRFQVVKNQVIGYTNHGVMSYVIGDDQYEEVYDIDHFYERITDENKASFITIPDKSEYTMVDSLFAI